MVSDLLPVKTSAPACRDFTRDLGVRPLGTGLRLDRVVVAEVAPPWPKPALRHDHLARAAAAVNASLHASRLFAAVPVGGSTAVEVFDRTGLGATRRRWELGGPDAIGPLVEAIEAGVPGRPHAVAAPAAELVSDGPVATPMLLICTQGSHDACCGTHGQALIDAVGGRPDIAVRGVSHTGGHRFAPTLMALPSGRMWAYADESLVDRIVAGKVTSADLLHRCRGWWGAAVGPAQVAEIVARAAHGAPFAQVPEVAVDPAGTGLWNCVVSAGSLSVSVVVDIARQVPTISCGVPGGLPAKPGREYSGRVTDRQMSVADA